MEVVLPELTARGACLSDDVDGRGVASDLPPGVGIPEGVAADPGDVAREDAEGGLLLLFLALRWEDPAKDKNK